MKEFLLFLDDKVGKGNYAVAVTADHGICPVVQVQQAKGIPAGRVPMGDLLKAGEKALQARFGILDGNFDSRENAAQTTWIETAADPGIYLNLRLIADRKLDKAEVAATLAKALEAVPGVQSAYHVGQLTG